MQQGSFGGQNEEEEIEMQDLQAKSGPSSSRRSRLEKSLSQPAQHLLPTTPGREHGTEVRHDEGSARPPFTRAQSIREAVTDFVGIGNEEDDQFQSRRLSYINKRYKLNKQFVKQCENESEQSVISSPAVYPSVSTPFNALRTDSLDGSRIRSSSIESRRTPLPKDSFFKIFKDTTVSMLTKGQLPTPSIPRLRGGHRSLQGQLSFRESPLHTLSTPTQSNIIFPPVTPGPFHDVKEKKSAKREHTLNIVEEEKEQEGDDKVIEEAHSFEVIPSSGEITPILPTVVRVGTPPSPSRTPWAGRTLQPVLSPPERHITIERPSVLPLASAAISLSSARAHLDNEVFFDVAVPSIDTRIPPLRRPPLIPELGSSDLYGQLGPVSLGGRMAVVADIKPSRPPPIRERQMPKISVVDRVSSMLKEAAGKQHKIRQGGEGVFGRLFNRKMKSVDDLPPHFKKKMQQAVNHRPFFTWWISVTQILVCVLSLFLYGTSSISVTRLKRTGEVSWLDDTLITVGVYEKGNFFFGPDFDDLIKLGAKYTPCMRKEKKIMERIEMDRLSESFTGCCIHSGNFCYQASESTCPRAYATLFFRRNQHSRGGLRKSQSAPELRSLSLSKGMPSEVVCGLDPEECDPPQPWNYNITKWQMCNQVKERHGIKPKNLQCKIVGRPCCIHLQGRCRITSEAYCDFVKGHYHPNHTLCSQVDCLPGVCGMLPFIRSESPDQMYRLVTSLFLHAGVLHLLVTLVAQFLFLRDLEEYIGTSRLSIIYMVSGIGGNLGSAIFAPFNPEVGPSGAHAGIVAALFVDVLFNKVMIENPCRAYLENGSLIIGLLAFGLFPWVDIWAMFFGTIFGFLSAMAVFPDVSQGKKTRRKRIVIVTASLTILTLLFLLLFIVFFNVDNFECEWCSYVNCVNFTPMVNILFRLVGWEIISEDEMNHFCDNQGLQLDSWLPI